MSAEILALTILLMILGVLGSFTPMIPGALLSITGILIYWIASGYQRPDIWFLIIFISTGALAVATDYLSGVITAKFGGASTKTSIAAGISGLIFFFLLGPIGILIGVVGTVSLREYLRTSNLNRSFKAGFYSGIGVLGSAAVQAAVTLSLLFMFLLALWA